MRWEIERVGTDYVVLVDDVPQAVAESENDAKVAVFRLVKERKHDVQTERRGGSVGSSN